jgi:NAD(P)-dependent dehydrogenase (short-subunit alcohol dehydrogenase family)
MKRLENKVALITGGNAGIGFATAKEFLAQGAEVIITARNKSKLEAALITLGNGAHGILSDAESMEDVKALPGKVKAITRNLDIIYLNAGYYDIIPFELNTEENYDAMTQVYNKGVYFTIQKLLPLMQTGGSIIVTNTIAVKNQTLPTGFSSMLIAKGAAATMSRVLANELAPKNIRVNTVSPGGIIDTPGAMKTISKALGVTEATQEHIKAFSQNMLPGIPMKRFGKASEVAKSVLFLASEESSYVTGIDLIVDGGKSITW